jgi:phosphomannomutase
VHHVAEQRRPDGRFPTVSFPNPEEPGAMDLVLALAVSVDADLVLANDPDADRLGVAIPAPSALSGWRALAGDEIGWLLADHVLRHTAGDDRLVVTTLVSSTLLAEMATAYGVHHAETPTGFKWIAAASREHPEQRLVFGYEQALGYLVSTRPLDKDGITAAVLFTEAAGLAKHEGVSLADRLDALAARFGRHRTAERSVRLEPAAAAVAVERAERLLVAEHEPIPGLVRFSLTGGSRVQVRSSGTEPKVKVYAEAVGGGEAGPLADAVAELLSRQG